jgi:hypothetical protein
MGQEEPFPAKAERPRRVLTRTFTRGRGCRSRQQSAFYAGGLCAFGGGDRAGELGRDRAARHRQLRLTVENVFLPERRTMPQIDIPLEKPMVALSGVTL